MRTRPATLLPPPPRVLADVLGAPELSSRKSGVHKLPADAVRASLPTVRPGGRNS